MTTSFGMDERQVFDSNVAHQTIRRYGILRAELARFSGKGASLARSPETELSTIVRSARGAHVVCERAPSRANSRRAIPRHRA
jgi:hypothetical protein